MGRVIHKIIVAVILLTSAVAQSFDGQSESRAKFNSSNEFDRLSLVMPSFVVHGIKPSGDASAYMPRKMDGSGAAVMTPGVGFEYVGSEGGVLMGALLKDCYDNLAGTIQFGKKYMLVKNTSIGFTMGIYARQSPFACSSENVTVMGKNTVTTKTTQTNCYAVDELSQRFMTNINGQFVDLIPLPFVHFNTALVNTKELRIDLKLMSNILLNEVGIGIPF